MKAVERFVQSVSILLLVIAPWPFGMVQDGWIFVFESISFLLLGAWVAAGMLGRHLSMVRTRLVWPAAVLVGCVLLTLLPLPTALVGVLSPRAAELYGAAAAAAGTARADGSISFCRVSLAPLDTIREGLKIAAYLAFFFLVLQAWRGKRTFLTAYHAIVANGALVALFGIVQNIWSNGLIYWRFESGSGTHFGPFVNHNHFAGYVQLSLGLAIGLIAAELRKGGPPGAADPPRILDRLMSPASGRLWCLLVAAVTMIIALVASLSRGGVISAVLTATSFTGFLVILRLNPRRIRGRQPGRAAALAASALITILLATVLLALSPRSRERWEHLADSAVQYRLQLWQDTVDAIQDFPVLGSGIGTFSSVYPAYKSRAFQSRETHAENEYLQWALETGVVGLILLVGAAWVLVSQVGSRLIERRNPEVLALTGGALFGLLSMSIHNVVDFNGHIPSNALTFAATAVLAILSVSWRRAPEGDRYLVPTREFAPGRTRGRVAAMTSLGLVGALGFVSFAVYLSSSAARRWVDRNAPVPAGQGPAALPPELSHSESWFRWNDESHALAAAYFETDARQAGFFRAAERKASLERARAEVVAALRLRPVAGRYWAQLGRIASAQQDFSTAVDAFGHAEALARVDGEVYRDHGYALLALGDPEAAAGRFALAREYHTVTSLGELLVTLAAHSSDIELWRRLVRRTPEDLREFASFLERRGHVREAEQARSDASRLSTSTKHQ